MSDVHLTISQGQREMLLHMLEDAIRGKRVEVRRSTYSHEFRAELEHQEEMMQDLIGRLSEATAPFPA